MSQNNINSPNMGLIIPTVGLESGPEYATDVNTSLLTIDQHDHSQGLGVQITPAGLNINTSLPFNNNFATAVAGITFQTQGSVPAAGTVYLSGRDMYFVDGLGNNIPITANGAVAGTPGSIANLVVPASASYVSATGTFVFQQNTNIAANLDVASLLFRNVSPNSTYAVTLSAPDALTSNYNIKLPVLPASSKIMTIDNTGQIYSLTDVDTTTMQISSNLIGVKPSGIDTNQIKDGAVTQLKLDPSIVVKQEKYTSNSSFAIPSTCTYVTFTIVGGGGGGGGGGNAYADARSYGGGGGGGGGNAGQLVEYTIKASEYLGQTVDLTIGAGGAGGPAATLSGSYTGGAGGAGGNTTVRIGGGDKIYSAFGGAGGAGGFGCIGGDTAQIGRNKGGNGALTFIVSQGVISGAAGAVGTGNNAVTQAQAAAITFSGSGGGTGGYGWTFGTQSYPSTNGNAALGGTPGVSNGNNGGGTPAQAGGGGGAGGCIVGGTSGKGGNGAGTNIAAEAGGDGTLGGGGGGGGGAQKNFWSDVGAAGGKGGDGYVIITYMGA